jgi:hypothetical protein
MKQHSVIGREATGFYFLGYGPDLLTLRNDLNRALSVVRAPKLIEISNVHSRKLPCVIVKGKKDELQKIQDYLAAHDTYTQR